MLVALLTALTAAMAAAAAACSRSTPASPRSPRTPTDHRQAPRCRRRRRRRQDERHHREPQRRRDVHCGLRSTVYPANRMDALVLSRSRQSRLVHEGGESKDTPGTAHLSTAAPPRDQPSAPYSRRQFISRTPPSRHSAASSHPVKKIHAVRQDGHGHGP